MTSRRGGTICRRAGSAPSSFRMPSSPLSRPRRCPAPRRFPELFRKAKEQVKLGSYEPALSTLQEIDKVSQQPGLEKDREALLTALAFYKGVCYAGLGQADEARGEFATFLAASPNTVLDPAMYPKKVVSVFEEAKKASATQTGDSEAVGMTAAYKAFKTPSRRRPRADRRGLGQTAPSGICCRRREADEYRHLADAASRSEFITQFWKARDPKPETPENEFRQEFEKRAAFADQYFASEREAGQPHRPRNGLRHPRTAGTLRRAPDEDGGRLGGSLGSVTEHSAGRCRRRGSEARRTGLSAARPSPARCGLRRRNVDERAVGELEGDLAVLPQGSARVACPTSTSISSSSRNPGTGKTYCKETRRRWTPWSARRPLSRKS